MADASGANDVRVANNADESRYEVFVDGSLAGFVTYRSTPKIIIFLHAEIDPALERHGFGSALAQTALDEARAHSQRVIPRCPFIAAYITEHPEYADLLVRKDAPSS